MKKTIVLIACLSLALGLAACAKKAEKKTASGAPSEPVKKKNTVVMAGEYTCPDFNLTIAAGWTATLETDGKVEVLPEEEQGSGLYFRFEKNASGTAEEAIGAVIAAEKGSDMETAVLNNVTFKTTRYSKGGRTRTVYVAVRDGVKITIIASGKRGKIARDLQAMLSTIQFR